MSAATVADMKICQMLTGWIPARFVFAALVWWCCMCCMCLQMNLNLSIVAMVNQTAVYVTQEAPSNDSECYRPQSQRTEDSEQYDYTEFEGGEFLWSSSVQGLLLGAVFFGYVGSHAIAGFLAHKLPCKLLMFICVQFASLLALLTPLATRTGGPVLLFALRTVQGFFMGAILPILYAMVARWTPVLERSVTVALTYMGGVLGSSLTMIIAGYLTSNDLTQGWTHVFYLSGGFGTLFCIVWLCFAHDTPEKHPNISQKEFNYITQSLSQEHSVSIARRTIPWKQIVCSLPIWSLAIIRCSCSWAVFLIQTAVPLYLQTALHIPLELNGIINGLMFMGSAFSSILSGAMADMFRRKTRMRTTSIRKIFCLTAYAGSAACWLTVSRIGCSPVGAFALLFFSKFFLTFSTAGDYVTVMDLAPEFAGPLSGILFTISDSMGFLCPLVTGIMTEDDVSIARWRKVFDLCAGILIFGLVQFLVFGSAEVQPWAKSSKVESSVPSKESDCSCLLTGEERTYETVSVQNSHDTKEKI